MKEVVFSGDAPRPIGPYSQAVKEGNFLFISGQIPADKDGNLVKGDIKAQTRQVLENIKAILEAAGAGLENVVKVTVYLKDMNDFGAMNEVYAEYFGESKPERAAIEVARLPKDVGIEIEAIAYL